MTAPDNLIQLFQMYGIALALGLVMGVERERGKTRPFAGIRTFPLIAVLGCAAAQLSQLATPWFFVTAFIALTALTITAYLCNPATRPGITTEVSVLLCFVYGALVWWQMIALAAALTVVTVLLLTNKGPLEELSKQIARSELAAGLQFGVITLIILPILPDQVYGPLAVLNPHTIWLMVVLIAAINFIGYIMIKWFGARHGICLAGVLGGIGSSTAVTLAFSRRSREAPRLAPAFALGIVMASTIMFGRLLIEAFTVNPAVGRLLLPPLLAAGGTGLTCCAIKWLRLQRAITATQAQEEIANSNPFELWPCILFGLLFGCVLFISKAAQVYFGTSGVYLSSAVTGLTDADPVTLSLASLAHDTISPVVAARGITLAALANTAMKLGITCTGSALLIRHALPIFILMIAAGLAVAFILI